MAVETSVDAVDAWSEEVEILLPFPYRIYDCDLTESIDSTWMELYVENDTFFIDNADFSIIEGMDDCSGYPTKTIQTERNTLVFLTYRRSKREGSIILRLNKSVFGPMSKSKLCLTTPLIN